MLFYVATNEENLLLSLINDNPTQCYVSLVSQDEDLDWRSQDII